MPRAILFDISTGREKEVEAGSSNVFAVSPEESKRGITAWKLKTPTQNFQTFKSPTREITRGEGAQLYTSEGGVNTPISAPSQLSSLVGQGYQDTRRQLDLPVVGGATNGGGGSMSEKGRAAAAPTPSPADAYQRFNDSVQQILLGMKSDGGLDLEKRRNALIKARFSKQAEITPEELRVLSPSEQASLRQMKMDTIEGQVGDVEAAITARERANKVNYDMAIDLLDRANESAQLGYKMDADEKDRARKAHEFYLTTFGSSYLDALAPEGRKNIETALGLGAGVLDKMGATLKEQSQEKGRYKVIGSTKYHGNIMYDSTEGKYVDGNGKEVSQSIVNEAMNTGRSGSGSGTSPISGVPASISNLARTYALDAYQAATGAYPTANARQLAINQWARAYEQEIKKAKAPVDPTSFNPFAVARERYVSEQTIPARPKNKEPLDFENL